MLPTRPSNVTASALLLSLLAACGQGLVETEIDLHGDFRLPPAEFANPTRVQALGGTQLVYVNFDGVTLDYGASDATRSTSWIVQRRTTFPRFAGYGSRQASIDAILAMVRADYARWNVEFVTTRPASGAYTMVVVGGLPSLVGESEGVAGLAPLDEGNPNPSDVVFAFSEVVWTDRLLANVISHEAGHSFGLDHLKPVGAIMYPTVHDNGKDFRRGYTYDANRLQDEPVIYTGLFGAKTAPAPAPEVRLASTFGSQSVPGRVKLGETFNASLEFVNAGSEAWTAAAGYDLRSVATPAATFGGAVLPLGATDRIAPGATKRFQAVFQAPAAVGLYEFRWQMAKGATFGAASTSVTIEIYDDAPVAPAGGLPAVGRFEFADKSWGYGWAFDPDQAGAPLEVQVYIDGTYAGSLEAADAREDLVASGELPSADHGFAFWMPTLSRGRHTITMYAVDTDGTPVLLPGSFRIRIR